VETDGEITFHCSTAPLVALRVNVLRINTTY